MQPASMCVRIAASADHCSLSRNGQEHWTYFGMPCGLVVHTHRICTQHTTLKSSRRAANRAGPGEVLCPAAHMR
eukprot:11179808-Lingulodinium_polyedra.AAC.2